MTLEDRLTLIEKQIAEIMSRRDKVPLIEGPKVGETWVIQYKGGIVQKHKLTFVSDKVIGYILTSYSYNRSYDYEYFVKLKDIELLGKK